MMRTRFLSRLRDDERGIALITAILTTSVVLSLSLVVVQLSIHNSDASAFDRKRVQAIHAAEAGLDVGLRTLEVTPPSSLPCTASATLSETPPASYAVTFSYYATYPPSGAALACPPASTPAGAKISAAGTAVTGGSGRPVTRTMQASARLITVRAPFDAAIFSNGSFGFSNQLTLNGAVGNDGNVYTNGNWTCSNAITIRGKLTALGTGTTSLSNSCYVLGDALVKGSITMANSARVGHDAISSTGSISLSNSSRIDHDARAATTCGGCTSTSVGGTITTSSLSPDPAAQAFPTLAYDATAWQAAGFTISSQSDCTAARTFIGNIATATKYVVRITPKCALAWANNTTVNVREDLAIITDGSIATANNTTFQSADGTPHTLYLIVPSASACSGSPIPNITTVNNTNFVNLRVFTFTPCTASFSNNNVGLGGQIYGGTVSIQNNFSMTYAPTSIPGAGPITGFSPNLSYVREVVNGT